MTLEEELVQFVFGLARGSSPRRAYRSLLERIFFQSEHHPNVENLKAVALALVAHTRDTVGGKGEYALFYQLMEVLVTMSEPHPEFAPVVNELLTKTVIPTDRRPPYGSWKDVKCLLDHLRGAYGESRLLARPIFDFAVQLLADQLLADSDKPSGEPISLAGKWAPREKRAFGWLAPHVAAACFPALPPTSACRAYRKLLSALNRRLRTVQVLQCERRWSDIDFDKHVTSRTLFRQREAFARGSDLDADRRSCQSNFAGHLAQRRQLNGDHVSAAELVKEALFQPKLVDAFWRAHTPPLGLVIPFVDTSASVAGTTKEPLYAAVGIGLQLAEQSAFGRRLFAFSSNATWVNLDGAAKLSDMVRIVPRDELGSNLGRAVALFLECVAECGVTPSSIEQYTLVIISDMNFDNGYGHADLKAQFRAADVPLPRIVYWNVAPSEHHPRVDVTEDNVTLLSGFQANAIGAVVNKKREGGHANTVWNKLVNTMCAPRYSWVWCVV